MVLLLAILMSILAIIELIPPIMLIISQILLALLPLLPPPILALSTIMLILALLLALLVLPAFLLTTNHIYIGGVYIITGLIGGAIGFGLPIILRLELALPRFIVCSSLQYNPNVSFHGIFMISSMIMPILIGGFGNILLPLMLCSSDMIFPRLNALSLWLVLNSSVIMFLAMFIDGGVNAGWTSYVPLSIINYSSIDLMFFSLHIVGLSSLLGSINSIATLLKSSNLSIVNSFLFLPLYCWSIFFTPVLLVISLPVLAGVITTIISDRHSNCPSFDPLRGGDLLLSQHLPWFLRHPEVHILILPAFGLISEMLSKFSQCIISGRDSMLAALLITAALGCIVWGHHMFMVGFDLDTRSYLTFATSIIAIPTGIKILNWLSTIYSGVIYLFTSLYFIIGFLFSSTFGGFTGPIPANSIIDTILHDPYFIIGHPHYAPPLGAIYTISAAFYTYWMLFTSIAFLDYLGRIHSGSSFISSNLISFTMHSLGIIGFPRRIYDYSLQFFKFQWFNSIGLAGIGLSLCVLLLAVMVILAPIMLIFMWILALLVVLVPLFYPIISSYPFIFYIILFIIIFIEIY